MLLPEPALRRQAHPRKAPISVLANTPLIYPSSVFPELNNGASLRFPQRDPNTYAVESANNVTGTAMSVHQRPSPGIDRSLTKQAPQSPMYKPLAIAPVHSDTLDCPWRSTCQLSEMRRIPAIPRFSSSHCGNWLSSNQSHTRPVPKRWTGWKPRRATKLANSISASVVRAAIRAKNGRSPRQMSHAAIGIKTIAVIRRVRSTGRQYSGAI